jgi:sugar phosphate permease
MALLGVFTYGPDTLIAFAATQDSTSWDRTGTAAGFVDGVGSLGQLLSPILVNFSVMHWGWPGFFRLAVVVAIAGSFTLAVGAKRLRL